MRSTAAFGALKHARAFCSKILRECARAGGMRGEEFTSSARNKKAAILKTRRFSCFIRTARGPVQLFELLVHHSIRFRIAARLKARRSTAFLFARRRTIGAPRSATPNMFLQEALLRHAPFPSPQDVLLDVVSPTTTPGKKSQKSSWYQGDSPTYILHDRRATIEDTLFFLAETSSDRTGAAP